MTRNEVERFMKKNFRYLRLEMKGQDFMNYSIKSVLDLLEDGTPNIEFGYYAFSKTHDHFEFGYAGIEGCMCCGKPPTIKPSSKVKPRRDHDLLHKMTDKPLDKWNCKRIEIAVIQLTIQKLKGVLDNSEIAKWINNAEARAKRGIARCELMIKTLKEMK